MASTVSAVTASLFLLARRRGPSELRWVIGLQLAFLSAVLGDDFGGPRATLTLLTVAILVLASETRSIPPNGPESASLVRPVVLH